MFFSPSLVTLVYFVHLLDQCIGGYISILFLFCKKCITPGSVSLEERVPEVHRMVFAMGLGFSNTESGNKTQFLSQD